MQPDDEICYCFHVSKRKILNFIRIHKPRRVSQVSECAGAGTGCGWCRPFLEKYFRESAQAAVTEPDEMTPEVYARMRAKYVRSGKGVPAPGATPLPADELGSLKGDPENEHGDDAAIDGEDRR
jgi:NAD(P)H-nitrite reductase large subunit